MLIDFNKAQERANKFLGSERKTTIVYNGELYMLKYPDPVRAKKVKDIMSYKNNQFSEHIGCQIFKSCGFETQDTLLGEFTDKQGKKKIVVACKDFTQNGGELYEFVKFANQTLLDRSSERITIEDVYETVTETNVITNKSEVISKFWDVFVVDALIGNRDRHLGNWGLIEKDGEFSFSPVYDCGSSLSALLDDDAMKKSLNDATKFKEYSFNVMSCYYMNDKRIFYHEIFKDPPDDLREAIKRIVPKIDMEAIYTIIDTTPQMSDIRKEYLKKAVELRYTQIILPALKRIQAKEKAE
jgi:hypothetical protein